MFKPKTIIGLDIGASSIKLAEIKRDKEKLQLVRLALVNLSLKERGHVVEAISKLLRIEKIRCAEVVVSVSGRSVFSRFVKLPRLTEQKISQIIKYEAQQQIPFPMEEVIWDYHLLKGSSNFGQINVALVAVKKDIIENLIRQLDHVDLEIKTIDVGPYALYNTLCFNNKFDNAVVLDIGAKTTNIIIARDGKIWTRNLLIAGDDITKAIAEGFGISFELAEEKKIKEGAAAVEKREKAVSAQISDFVEPVLIDLLTEVSRSIGYYKAHFGGDAFNVLLLTGGTANLGNIDKFFEKNLKLKTYYFDFFKNITVKEKLLKGDLVQQKNRLGVVLGLALRAVTQPAIAVDLIPPQLIRIKELKRKLKYFFACGILAAALMIVLNNQLIQKSEGLERQIEAINLVLSEYQNFEKEINWVRLEIEPIEKKVDFFEKLAQEKMFWLDIFSNIADNLTEDIWFTDIRFQDAKTILLEGKTTGSFLTVTNFGKELEKSAFFENVETLKANMEKEEISEEQIPGIVFSFRAALENRSLMFR